MEPVQGTLRLFAGGDDAALRGIDDETIAFRTEEWSVLPRWDSGEFIFEYYAEEPDTFHPGDDETQIVVTNVPWGNL